MISVPRPAMLVATVMHPGTPACAIRRDSWCPPSWFQHPFFLCKVVSGMPWTASLGSHGPRKKKAEQQHQQTKTTATNQITNAVRACKIIHIYALPHLRATTLPPRWLHPLLSAYTGIKLNRLPSLPTIVLRWWQGSFNHRCIALLSLRGHIG